MITAKRNPLCIWIATGILLLTSSCANKSSDAGSIGANYSSTIVAGDPLPSWNEGENKKAIIDFVSKVTTEGSASFVKQEDRIATFDNDGTLWAEQPIIQLLFVFERARQMATVEPALANKQPFKAIVENDKEYLETLSEDDVIKLFVATQTGMTESEYAREAAGFFSSAQSPSGKPISHLVYQPQLELLNYLRANGFKTFICSGGSVEFMRVISQKYYGIPPEQVIGTQFKYIYKDSAGVNDIVRQPGLHSFNDKQEKPMNIQYFIGKRPILACGNEGGGGDIYMLRFSQGSSYPSLQLLVNHDDKDREFYYQEKDNKSLDWAKKYNWNVISMKDDWKRIFRESSHKL